MLALPPTAPPRRRTSTDENRAALFREAAAVIRAGFDRPITFGLVADQVTASPRQLRRAFSEAGGTTFAAYLREVRLARAAELLAATDVTVGAIAKSVGYRQPSQFTKAFKRAYGATPSRYRLAERGLVPNGQVAQGRFR